MCRLIRALQEPPLHRWGTENMTFAQLLMELIQLSLIHLAFLQVCRAVGDLLHLFNTQGLRTHGTHLLRFQQPEHTNHTHQRHHLNSGHKNWRKAAVFSCRQTSVELAQIPYPWSFQANLSEGSMHLWLTEQIASGEQEIHNEDTHTSLPSACGDPEQSNKVPDEQKKKNRGKVIGLSWKCLPWQYNRAGCSCRRHTEVGSEGADIHRRDTESFPPPPLLDQGVCTPTARKRRSRIKHTLTEKRRRGGENLALTELYFQSSSCKRPWCRCGTLVASAWRRSQRRTFSGRRADIQ